MLTLKTLSHLHLSISPKSPFISSPPHHFLHLSPISSKIPSFTTNMPLTPIIEHIVLFKVRNSTDPSKIQSMITNLRSLTSLNIATHLTAGPILRLRSAAAHNLAFTHLLYSRYRTKADLAAYSDHPLHLSLVKENVVPICDDIMALDWVADVDVDDDFLPGSLLRIALSKPREGVAGAEIVRGIDGVRGSVKVSYGENFSPGRAKGYEVGFVSVFSGADEADAIEGDEEIEKSKEKMRQLVESVVVVDYLVPSPASNL